MLKISPIEPTDHSHALRLEGRLVGPWVQELQQVCEPLMQAGGPLQLDLAEVSFADDHGIALLTGLHSHGTQLLRVTPFLAEQLKAQPRLRVPS